MTLRLGPAGWLGDGCCACWQAASLEHGGDVPPHVDAVAEAAHEAGEASIACVDRDPAAGRSPSVRNAWATPVGTLMYAVQTSLIASSMLAPMPVGPTLSAFHVDTTYSPFSRAHTLETETASVRRVLVVDPPSVGRAFELGAPPACVPLCDERVNRPHRHRVRGTEVPPFLRGQS